ncbi:glutathione S-transferase family protein [Sandarakinorhabdus sp. AAP62]|uniref:glutathione S-transferase family protein n=1 Tax=Sandarakinorhabdus sp. AAP62 TaxID=1248916 RepID=UPI000307D0A5|nr:glutathione S-transferase family protein [Sandarakinorhabdus sp. AAP62]
MKLYDSIGPNPRVVRMAMAEKGISLPSETIDIMAGVNRSGDYIKKVPAGSTPALELDDGSIVSEITVIAEYLEEIHPAPAIIGSTPEERAETRRWVRIIDLGYCETMANGFRATQGRPMFEPRFPIMSESGGEELKALAAKKLAWLDGLMKGEFVCGDRFTLADILLFCFVEFGAQVGQPLPAGLTWLPAWRDRVAARPSAAA